MNHMQEKAQGIADRLSDLCHQVEELKHDGLGALTAEERTEIAIAALKVREIGITIRNRVLEEDTILQMEGVDHD